MKADAHFLQGLLHGGDQFIIPLFQRYYVWQQKDWQRLWDDLTDLLEEGAPSEHFMGSLVCMQGEHKPGKIPQYLVIDGQQRLTTFVILLCALRDVAEQVGNQKIAGQIQENYLTHKYNPGLDYYKVVPRLRDRQGIFDLVDRSDTFDEETRIRQAYHFFTAQLRVACEAEPGALQRLFTATTGGLSLVMITLQNENPFTIFETLNSTGQRLEEADLIRNHVFLQVPITEQDAFDDDRWRPFEDSLLASEIYDEIKPTEFYRDFLMRNGKYVRRNGVYLAFQDAMVKEPFTPATLVAALNRYVRYYRWLRSPETVPDPAIASELHRLSWLYLSTAYPLLLHLLALHDEGALPAAELCACLRAIQSFAIRRTIAGESTRPYSQFFPAVARDLDHGDVVGSLHALLTKRGWPADATFGAALVEFPIYRREPELARLLLMVLEESTAHKEAIDVAALLEAKQLQLEHVLPQTLTTDWRAMLGEHADEDHRRLVHVLGNLTFSGYNPELSNKPFAHKRALLQQSNVQLNKAIAASPEWTAAAIDARGRHLAQSVMAVWPVGGSV